MQNCQATASWSLALICSFLFLRVRLDSCVVAVHVFDVCLDFLLEVILCFLKDILHFENLLLLLHFGDRVVLVLTVEVVGNADDLLDVFAANGALDLRSR